MEFLKNIGGKTAILIGVLILMFATLFVLWRYDLVSLPIFIIFGLGCMVFIVLNVIDRKKQLRKVGDSLIEKADKLFAKGEVKGAIRDYEKALKLQGASWGAYLGLGHCYKGMNDYKKTMEYAKKALECKSDSSAALYLMGICMFRQDYHDSAMKYFDNALQLSPDLLDAYMMKGEVCSSLGRFEDAIINYNLYIDKSKDEKIKAVAKEKVEKLLLKLKQMDSK